MSLVLQSNLTCPECGFIQKVEMPTRACQFFYNCVNCRQILKPKVGDCCVFCSYGDVPCPPRQGSGAFRTMLASEAVLWRDWDRSEEDEAGAHL